MANSTIMTRIVGVALCLAGIMQMARGAQANESLALIRLHNPTQFVGPMVAEIPVGRIANPAIIDWTHIRLVSSGNELPHAIREGRANWKATLKGPTSPPRPEDLLVFSVTVPPGEWVVVHVVQGAQQAASHTARDGDLCRVKYGGLEAAVDLNTGQLVELSAFGVPVLAAPFTVSVHELETPGYSAEGTVGPGHQEMNIVVHAKNTVPAKSHFLGESSTPAFTELRFEIRAETGLAVGLVYRFHAAGVVELELDERPWEGDTPWAQHAVMWTFPLHGEGRSLPRLETRFPFYGFKDHAAAFHQIGNIRTLNHSVIMFELGEQAVNGRRWYRRLHVTRNADEAALVDSGIEGLIIDVEPLRGRRIQGPVTIDAPGVPTAMVSELRDILPNGPQGEGSTLRLRIVGEDQQHSIGGDGFAIVPVNDRVTELRACTRLGLFMGTRELARQLRDDGVGSWPLVARNPVVSFRGGGFGGGPFEVDFPYGTDEEWETVLRNLLDSGMETFACLGMWGNWKMPVGYKYMPELRSDDLNAYDESSGTLLSELEEQREHGLKLLRFLQDRGGRVILWLPIGCVPSTFPAQYPEAIMPGSTREFWGRPKATPCFSHVKYREYVSAFLRELTETYPFDGLMLVRDDNGTICTCDRCATFLTNSRTGNAAWEQYLIIYDTLREMGFDGSVAVYPYFDPYTPDLEKALPRDVYIVGHGASVAGLTRAHENVGHMGDTWLDNLYTNFRLPTSSRVRRLNANRPAFWIGGAYCGTELPWEAIGYFGWEPTATPNSFRYAWGERTFGKQHALRFVRFSQAYENLWETNARFMLPKIWLEMTTQERERAYAQAMAGLATLRNTLADLETANKSTHEKWFAHVGLFPVFFDYHLHRLKLFGEICDLTNPHIEAIAQGQPLPNDVSQNVVTKYREMHERAQVYGQHVAEVPGAMLAATRNMTGLYKEWMAGYDAWLDPHLPRPQFAGRVNIAAKEPFGNKLPRFFEPPVVPLGKGGHDAVTYFRTVPKGLQPGKPGTVEVELVNTGLCPWIPESAHRLKLGGIAKELGLPDSITYNGPPIAPGGHGTVTLKVTVPAQAGEEAGEGILTVGMFAPYRVATEFAETKTELTWHAESRTDEKQESR